MRFKLNKISFLVAILPMLFFALPILAQENLDDLIAKMDKMQNNREKYNSLIKIIDELSKYDIDLKEVYIKEAVKVSTAIKDTFLMIDIYKRWGDYEIDRSNYQQSMLNYQELLFLQENFQYFTDTLAYSKTLNDIGNCHRRMGNFDKALEFYHQAFQLRLDVGNKRDIASSYNDLGNTYMYLKNYDKAEEFLNKSREMILAINDSATLVHTSLNQGNLMYRKGKMDEAIKYYNEGLEIGRKLNDVSMITACLNNIASIYYFKDDYLNAIKIHKINLEEREKIGEKHAISISHYNLGNCYTWLSDFKKAMGHYEKAKEIQTSIDAKASLLNTLQAMAEMNVEAKKFETAIEYYDELILLKDSFLTIEKLKFIEENEALYNNLRLKKELEVYEKENQILLLKKENAEKNAEIERTQKILAFIFFPLLIAFGFLGYNKYYLKKSTA
jgi:tetratricopeptide (TPR) repeat protein